MVETVGESVPACPQASHFEPRIAYLLSQYPARSHTFFLKEVLGLRSRGLQIEVASINAPDRDMNELSPIEAAEAHSTYYVKQASRWRSLLAIASTTVRRPRSVISGLRAILRLRDLSWKQRIYWLFYLAEALLVGRWMRQRDLRHLHVHFGGAVASVGMLTSVMWNIPFSLTIHGPEELLAPGNYQLSAKLSQAAFVLCVSDFCRSSLQELSSTDDWPKLSVVRLGVEPLLLLPEKKSERLPDSPLLIVCVGRLVAEKGHRILLQAFKRLLARGVSGQLLLIGTGPLGAELRCYVMEQDLQHAVTFTSGLGHDETLAHVRQADIFALASFAEGVPVALMEAMSLQVPCVSTTVAGIPELISSGRSGLLVSPGDVDAFADALTLLAGDESLRSRIAHGGRLRVQEDYDLPRNLNKLAQVFREQLAEYASPAPSLGTQRSTGQR